jgi:hypothetical protein
MAKKYVEIPQNEAAGPPVKSQPLKVSFLVYVISLLVVALLIFILMLVQYFPGYQKSHKIKQAVKNSDVTLTVEIPEKELESRDYNPTNKKFKDSIADVFRQLGAKKVVIEITPQTQ